MKQIKLIDYYGIKNFHEIINLSLIVMCSRIFSKVTYISGASTYSNLNKLITKYNYQSDNITLKKCRIYEKDTSIGALLRTIYGFFISLFTYLCSKRKTILLYVYTNPLSLPLILLFNRFLNKKIIFTMHGELELQNKINDFTFIVDILTSQTVFLCFTVDFEHMRKKNIFLHFLNYHFF